MNLKNVFYYIIPIVFISCSYNDDTNNGFVSPIKTVELAAADMQFIPDSSIFPYCENLNFIDTLYGKTYAESSNLVVRRIIASPDKSNYMRFPADMNILDIVGNNRIIIYHKELYRDSLEKYTSKLRENQSVLLVVKSSSKYRYKSLVEYDTFGYLKTFEQIFDSYNIDPTIHVKSWVSVGDTLYRAVLFSNSMSRELFGRGSRFIDVIDNSELVRCTVVRKLN